MGLTVLGFKAVPVGFIPEQDKGYLVVNAQLPDGASLERTDAVVTRTDARSPAKTQGVAHTIERARLLDPAQHEHQQRRRHVRHPQAVRGAGRQARAERRPRSPTGCASKFARDPGGAGGRLRRPAGRRPGQHRRLQAAGAGPRAAPAWRRCKAPWPDVADAGQRASRGWSACSAASASTSRSSSWRSTEEKAKAQQVALERRRRDAAGLPRLGLRQRLHLPEPQLAGQRPGRRPTTACRPRTSATSRSATPRATGCRWSTLITVHDDSGPADRQPLQPVPLGRDQRQHGPRASAPARPSRIMDRPGREGAARRRWASSGPS